MTRLEGEVGATSTQDRARAQEEEELAALRRENAALRSAVAELERVSVRDMVTPLTNRRFFLSALHQRLARAERYAETAALIYADVDGLKAINDRHGHGGGDRALIAVAERLRASVRTTDVVSRIGGDEFGLILDRIDEREALRQVERLRGALGATPFDLDGVPLALSASFGVALVVPGATEEGLLGTADQAMYRDKAARRSA